MNQKDRASRPEAGGNPGSSPGGDRVGPGAAANPKSVAPGSDDVKAPSP